jgi:hypothetical protein
LLDGVGKGIDQEQLALLRREPAHAHEHARCGVDRTRRLEEIIVHAAVHDADLVPLRRFYPALQLGGAVVADGDDEGGASDLVGERKANRRVELVRTVYGERIGWAPHVARDQRYGGRIGAEMHVQMIDATLTQLVDEQHGLAEIGRVLHEPAMAEPGEGQGARQPSRGRRGTRQRRAQRGLHPASRRLGEQAERPSILGDVIGVHQGVRCVADGKALDAVDVPL